MLRDFGVNTGVNKQDYYSGCVEEHHTGYKTTTELRPLTCIGPPNTELRPLTCIGRSKVGDRLL